MEIGAKHVRTAPTRGTKQQTWHSRHPNDEERFFRALETVVRNPEFNADRLGEYMDEKRANGELAQANLIEEVYEKARDHYVAAAWTVVGYLHATGQRGG